MGLFDHLFKHRPDDADERTIEGRRRAAARNDDPLDPQAAFLQPKGYAPGAANPAIAGSQNGFVPVLPSARRPQRAAEPAVLPSEPNEIVLIFGDVLPRIPVQFLRPGSHDLKRELRFHLEDLASDFSRGRAGVALSRIAEQCPECFNRVIGDDDDMEVRLPLQKLVEQIARIRSLPGAAPQTGSREPIRALRPPAPAWAGAPVPPPSPVATPPLPPTSLVPPVADPVAPQEPSRPVSPIIQEAPASPIPPMEEVSRARESEAPQAEAPVLPGGESPASAEAAPVPVEHTAFPAVDDLAASAQPPILETPVPEREPDFEEPPQPAPAAEPPPVLRLATANEIDLSLAAITAVVPAEMLAAGRPQIAENYRISLPFAPIERQLGTGSVEVSAGAFWDALPPMLRHHFVLREDLRIPLPLEEIFQNLPVAAEKRFLVPEIAATAVVPPEAPIMLVPAPALDDQTGLFDFDRSPEPVGAETPPPLPIAEAPTPESATPSLPTNEPPPPEPPSVVHPPELVIAAAPDASEPADAPTRLAGPLDADTVPAPVFETPVRDEVSVPVNLPPFRIFAPQVQATESADRFDPVGDQPIVLGQSGEAPVPAHDPAVVDSAPSAPPPEPPPTTAAPEEAAGVQPHAGTADLGVESAIPAVVTTSVIAPVETSPRQTLTRFSVLPARELDTPPDEFDGVVAFNADQPPPVTVAPQSAAVAVLHATISSPPPVMVAAGPTTSVQPPRMVRPVVLPPPISGYSPVAPVDLAPTLGGSAPDSPGSITLGPVAAPEPSTPPPTIAPPKIVQSPDVVAPAALKPPVAQPSPAEQEPAPAPKPQAAALPRPAGTAAAPPALHLHLPPLPATAPAAPSTGRELPPALPISRFDQHSLQSLFMTDETLDTSKVARLAAALPGIEACVISARGDSISSGNVPPGFELAALRALAPQVGATADRLPIGELKNFTLFGAAYSVSFFERGEVCLSVVHRARSFVPGVREKLVAVTEELAR